MRPHLFGMLLSLVLLMPLTVRAEAGAPTQAQRACTQKSDCRVVMVGCPLCGNGGHFEAVNSAVFASFMSRAGCSDEQMQKCMTQKNATLPVPSVDCQEAQCVWYPQTEGEAKELDKKVIRLDAPALGGKTVQ